MTVRSVLFFSALAVATLLTPASAETAKPKDNLDLRFENGIVAVVEEKAITVEQVRRELGPLIPELQRRHRTEEEYNKALESLQGDIIQNLIDRELIIKEFRKDEEKKIPQHYIDEQIAQTEYSEFEGDRSKFLAYLRARGKTQREYRKEIEDDIIYSYMRQQLRKNTSVVSPVKIETYYKENKEKFYQDDSVDMRLIQLNRGDQTEEQLLAAAAAVVARLQAGEDFENVAKQVSQDSRRSRGGDWGWQKRSDLRPEFVEPLFALKKGQFTQPVYVNSAAFILYVNDRRYAGIQPIENVRGEIEQILSAQMGREAQDRWLERLRRNGYVKYY
jgi:peptidyl-prolyl cis-trans isomerase SurA